MASRFLAVTIDCADTRALATFWAGALGYDLISASDDWAFLRHPTDAAPVIALQRVPEPKATKNRVHIDLHTHGDATRASERQRLEGLGATHLRQVVEPDETHELMADPEGNEFCLLGPV
jgi:hypothetical protein